jgi:hypothetical protein
LGRKKCFEKNGSGLTRSVAPTSKVTVERPMRPT